MRAGDIFIGSERLRVAGDGTDRSDEEDKIYSDTGAL
jgi:hypothetical protein